MERQGLIVVHTGNGKGKTTAALGLAIRAWGGGLKVLIMQFIKGGWKYGELQAMQKFAPDITIKQMGEGFVNSSSGEERQNHMRLAKEALAEARQALLSMQWDMVILDEINYAVKFALIEEQDVLDLLTDKPKSVHLVLTGRDASVKVVESADLVTEMREIKHPLKQGIKAQQGIEF